MKRITFVLILVALLVLASSVLAMESTHYSLAWFTPMTGSGGTAASSNYSVSFTVGQSAVGATSSTNYEGCLGYWCQGGVTFSIYLPLVLRNA